MALTNKLTAIAEGFRTSRGTSDKYTLEQMAVLAAEPIGGGGGEAELPEEALNITGNIAYKFYSNSWNWFMEMCSDKIRTTNLTNLTSAFAHNNSTSIPFTLNVNKPVLTDVFKGSALKISPKIRGTLDIGTSLKLGGMLETCYYLNDVEDLFEASMLEDFKNIKVTSSSTAPYPVTFNQCYSLRSVPSWWYKFKLNESSTAYPRASNGLYYYLFNSCASLDVANNIPVWSCTGAQTSNMFSSTFGGSRLKSVTFETNNGVPIETKWKAQTISLTSCGFTSVKTYITNYNSGITADKEVKDDATYQALKNDPDWFATKAEYSRYNHDSAVETINSY